MTLPTIQIVPTAPSYAADLNRCIDAVARERSYLGFIVGPPLDATEAFMQALADGAGIQFLAIDEENRVVGWCDIFRNPREGFQHSGVLGMGLLAVARGQGLGERLATATIERAWAEGFERIELEVFATNDHAARLYGRLGFVVEGIKRRSRKLDGRYDDNVCMALLRTLDGDPQ